MLIKQKVKYIQSLGQKKFREQEKCFIAEGPKLVKDLLEANSSKLREIFATPGWLEENEEWVGEREVTLITPAELEKISQLVTPNKVLALVDQYEVPDIIDLSKQVTLALDTIQDPGNFGTIIRIADWFGIKQVVAGNDSADLYNTKVVQATMGSIARVKVFYRDLEEWLSSVENIPVYATDLAGKDVSTIEKIKEGIIVIGNESRGISESVLKLANVKLTIPKKGKAESLNAAVATGIILSHTV